ncbi:IS1380 family transposase [Pedobacter sp. P26]|uniref:IS1380 family transposase n=1 Tax=Pedobacter sp. P26 TaxID=3423956 RepID=UPI003D668FEF
MKIRNSNPISSFGGINFVFDYLNKLEIDKLCHAHLPCVAAQSKYSWKDVFYSLKSVFLCGGDSVEDLHTHLKSHFLDNPYLRLASPDTVLRRLSGLTEETKTCVTKRGVVTHQYCTNQTLENFNLEVLKKIGVLDSQELTLDYDNTIIFNEKQDSKMTYKRDYGYQPGVCTVNEQFVLYIENRNGNSDAKSFQRDTLERIFNLLETKKVKKIKNFRADAASYQYEVVTLLQQKVEHFYIGCRNSYVEKYFPQICNWKVMEDKNGLLEVGYTDIIPFINQAREQNQQPQTYRLIAKRRLKKDGQVDLITQDAYEYRGILTNNFEMDVVDLVHFYNQRGRMERQFDILKNDFGWNNMPFSTLNKNLVFLYLTAICRNIYNKIIDYFSQKVKTLKPCFRLKKFLFRFIIRPAKWVRQGRKLKLRIYSIDHSYP